MTSDDSAARATMMSAPDSVQDDLPSGQEPTTTGTLFLMLIFLMFIAGFWGMMYVTLLHR